MEAHGGAVTKRRRQAHAVAVGANARPGRHSDRPGIPRSGATKERTVLNHEATKPVQELRGEFVKRKPEAKKVYRVEGYCRTSRRWELVDCDDVNRCIYVKPGTLLFAGFTY